MKWLERYGNPYRASFYDADGRVGIDYGVYGVPETYVIDKRGVIRYKQIGPVTPEIMASGQVAERLWGAEQRRARGLARSASCDLTRRGCLSAVSKANVASSATGPRDRAAQGSRCAAPAAPAKRSSLPGRAFAAPSDACKTTVQSDQKPEGNWEVSGLDFHATRPCSQQPTHSQPAPSAQRPSQRSSPAHLPSGCRNAHPTPAARASNPA